MDELTKAIEQNKKVIFIALAAVMFVCFAFCPAVDVLGKVQFNGFEIVFDGEGIGFARFLSVLLIIAPIVIGVFNLVEVKLQSANLIGFTAAFALCAILGIKLEEGVSLAWGSWIYLFAALLGIVVCNINVFSKK